MFCLELAEISSLVFLVLFKDRTQAESRVLSLGGLRSLVVKGVCYNVTKLR